MNNLDNSTIDGMWENLGEEYEKSNFFSIIFFFI